MPSTAPLVSDGASDSLDLMPTPPATIQLQSLLGSTSSEHLQTLHSLYAAQIATLVWLSEDQAVVGGGRHNVIVGIALKKVGDEQERRMFHGVMKALKNVLV